MKKIHLLTFVSLFVFFVGFSQTNSPAPAQSQTIAITGATAHLGNGQVIENSIIVFENGKFTGVMSAKESTGPKGANIKYVDASGKHLYPGFISLCNNLGLVEINAVRSTRDFREIGEINPSIRALIAYNTDSEVIRTVRTNGVLMSQVTPEGGMVAGQSSLVQLDAWNWEDAAVVADLGIHVYWPRKKSWNWRERKVIENKNYPKSLATLEQFFAEAKAYNFKTEGKITNLKFEASADVFTGKKKLFIHVNGASAMREAVLLAKRSGITPVIVGGRDAWMMTDFLKKNEVAVILGPTQSLPGNEDADLDQPYKTPGQLQRAGVLFSISEDGHWRARNLPFQAGQAVAFGLEREAAVQAMTQNAAKILGVDDLVGTIEVGKDATFFISEGDALDMRGNAVKEAYIQGRQIDLDNKQKALSRKFRGKYSAEKK